MPTIVIFTPYNRRFKTKDSTVDGLGWTATVRDLFVTRGYALLVVDVRGTGASFGRRTAFRSPLEREDYRQVADWIVSQAWSNGVIGSTGISYLGAAACFLASTGHPAVKAIAPISAVSDSYSEQLYPGGMLSRIWSREYSDLMLSLDRNDPSLIRHIPKWSNPGLLGPHPVDRDLDEALLRQALAEHRDNASLHDLLPEWSIRGQGTLDDPALTVDACSPCTYLKSGAAPDIPIYSLSGWYDGAGYANGSISRFLTMAGTHDRLMLGGWEHGGWNNVSPYKEHQTPQVDFMSEILRFFDQHLMGLKTGIEEESPVHYFSMHSERWEETSAWPPKASSKSFLTRSGELLPTSDQTAGELDFQVCYRSRTGKKTRYERLGGYTYADYYEDWAELCQPDLGFVTAPLVQDMILAGHIVAHLALASSEPDASIFIYASEVETDGKIRYITEGMLRMVHRKESPCPSSYITTWPYRSFTRDDLAPLTPGEFAHVNIALLPVAWTVKQGSRLRISLTGADIDHFPTTPHGRPPLIRLAVGGATGSSISLPIAERDLGAAPQ